MSYKIYPPASGVRFKYDLNVLQRLKYIVCYIITIGYI